MRKLQKWLKENRYSQRMFAGMIHTTPNNFGLLVNGKSTPGLRLAWEIEKNTDGAITLYDWLPHRSITTKNDQKKNASTQK